MENFHARGKLFFKGHIFHIRCCAHILNLIVRDGIHAIKDVIENIRCSVTYLKKFPSRLHRFGEIARQLSITTSKGLALDVATRWNSTYIMLEHALVYKNVFQQYATRDTNYKWLHSEEDWERAKIVCEFLEIFYDVTNIFSGSLYPTANLFLSEVWKIKKSLNIASESEVPFLNNMVMEMKKKFDKYWGDCNMLMAIAAILDPCLKLKLVEYCFPKIYSTSEAEENIWKVKEVLYDIYNTYVLEKSSSRIVEDASVCSTNERESTGSIVSSGLKVKGKGRAEFQIFVGSSHSTQPVRSKLEIYLEEQILILDYDDTTTKFDALDWWKLNVLKFPTLSKMARDILSIPVTTVSSESAFSAGGRVLNDFRSSLNPDAVEALVCGGSWIREFTNMQITCTNLHLLSLSSLEMQDELDRRDSK
ncbi:zinc finger BED domain-containing protein RICESLEEPER 2-like isoform X1 [Typha latifolia]|uniref:zinc finger BED domain-containing protein RICESLEEPER 2-like isoform X1 n=2 Tax=Typha latifolia TaxID=4733 RepID=UPI003C2E39E5